MLDFKKIFHSMILLKPDPFQRRSLVSTPFPPVIRRSQGVTPTGSLRREGVIKEKRTPHM